MRNGRVKLLWLNSSVTLCDAEHHGVQVLARQSREEQPSFSAGSSALSRRTADNHITRWQTHTFVWDKRCRVAEWVTRIYVSTRNLALFITGYRSWSVTTTSYYCRTTFYINCILNKLTRLEWVSESYKSVSRSDVLMQHEHRSHLLGCNFVAGYELRLSKPQSVNYNTALSWVMQASMANELTQFITATNALKTF